MMGRGRQARNRLPAVFGFRPPDLNGPGDMAQVILGPVAEIDEAEARVFLIDEVLQLFRLDQDLGVGVISLGHRPGQVRRQRPGPARPAAGPPGLSRVTIYAAGLEPFINLPPSWGGLKSPPTRLAAP